MSHPRRRNISNRKRWTTLHQTNANLRFGTALLIMLLSVGAYAYPVAQEDFHTDPQFTITSTSGAHSITATNIEDLLTVAAWADQSAATPVNIYQYFLGIGVNSGAGNGALIDGSESMTLQLDKSVGASMIEFNYTGGSGSVHDLARISISGFSSNPVASEVVYNQSRISNISYSGGTLSFDCTNDNGGGDYEQLLLANPAASVGATLKITGAPSPNGDATGWFTELHELNIQEAVGGPQLSPTAIPQGSANTVSTADGKLTVKGFSNLNASSPANLGRYYDQCFGISGPSTVSGNASVTLQFAGGIGLSRLDSVYSGGHLAISGLLSDPGLVDPTAGATSSSYSAGVLTITVADGGFHRFYFRNRAASAGQTLKLTDTDSQFGIAVIGYSDTHALLGPDITSEASPTYSTPDGLVTLTGYSDTPGTVPANLHENVDWFGVSGGANTESTDGSESLTLHLAPGAGLLGLGTRYTSGQVIISGFAADPGFTDPSGTATGVSYSAGTLSYTFNAPHSPEIVVSFANLAASVGQNLSLHTDGNPGSQLTLTRINYSAPVNLSIVQSGTNVIVSWPGGTLQQSTNVLMNYTDVSGATSPYTNAISGPQKFFRVRVQ